MSKRVQIILGRVEENTGAPRRLLLLASGLQASGHRVTILSSDSPEFQDLSETHGVDTHLMRFARLRPSGKLHSRLYLSLLSLVHILRQNVSFINRPESKELDLLIVRGSRNLIGTALLFRLTRKAPIVWDIGYEPRSSGVMWFIHRLCFWMSDTIVCQYKGAAEDIGLIDSSRRNKIVAVFPAISGRVLERPRASRLSMVRPDNLITILQIGTVCDRKNQLFSISIIRQLLKRLPGYSIRLSLVGGHHDVRYLNEVKAYAEEFGLSEHVELVGWTNDVESYMVSASVLLAPSKNEGVSNTIQEALSVGLPVISSDKGGAKEFIEHGETGFICTLNDSEDWVDCLVLLAENEALYAKISEQSAALARDLFSEPKWLAGYMRAVDLL